MRTLLALFLSVGLMTTAKAEGNWHFIAGGAPGSDGTRLSYFYDPTSLSAPNEDTRQVVILAEYMGGMQSAMTFGESEVSVITFDCQIERMRSEQTEWYELSQARGALSKTFERSDWQPLYGTELKIVRSFICSS